MMIPAVVERDPMIRGAVRRQEAPDAFGRLHGLFVRHFGFAVVFAFGFSAFAATQAPWTRNLRGLIDPAARPESTAAFLFGLPLLLAVGWFTAFVGGDVFRRTAMMRHPAVEFAVAGLAVLIVFALSIQRGVAAILVAS